MLAEESAEAEGVVPTDSQDGAEVSQVSLQPYRDSYKENASY